MLQQRLAAHTPLEHEGCGAASTSYGGCQWERRALLQGSRAGRRPGAGRAACRAEAATLEKETLQEASVKEPVDWSTLGFGIDHVAPTMYRAVYSEAGGWQGSTAPYGPLALDPSAQVLNYGQSIFEGLKAQRSARGRTVLFRPTRNAARMRAGAERLSMPAPPEELFLEAVTSTVKANASYVPPQGQGTMYLRPLLLGTGPILGLGPAPSYTLVCFGASVGAYFKGGQLTPIDLTVEERFHRAAPGGMGGTKAAGNYSPVLNVQLEAKRHGFADVVYLDAKSDTYLEEVSSCNIFVVKGRSIATPALLGTVLPGVTRASILELASARGYTVEERQVSVAEAMEADEIFTTGTAVVLSAVGSLTHQGRRREFGEPGKYGPVALELFKALTDLQLEISPDPFGWVYPVC